MKLLKCKKVNTDVALDFLCFKIMLQEGGKQEAKPVMFTGLHGTFGLLNEYLRVRVYHRFSLVSLSSGVKMIKL